MLQSILLKGEYMDRDHCIFEILSPIGCTVRGHLYHWFLVCNKHPEIADLLAEFKDTIAGPELIVLSKTDPAVYLCYQRHQNYWLSAVCKRLNGEGFLITAYITDKIKEGKLIWQK